MTKADNGALPFEASRLGRLCTWAADYQAMEIPAAVYRQAAVVLCDDLAAMISARHDPVLAQATDQYLSDGGKPVATVFNGGNRRTDRYNAAAANGAAAPWNELDEGSRLVPCHAGIYALPALLAEAEAENLSVRESLRCLVVAYEIATRFALTFSQPALTLHPHASLAALGAGAAVAAARRYDAEHFHRTLTIASTLVNPGPFDHAVRGSFVRNMWVANAATSGLRAADWALCGITGLADSPQSVFQGIFGTECDLDRLSNELGSDWLINHNFQKIYPCCQYLHSMIEAICNLIPTLPTGVNLRDCEQAVIEIHDKGMLLDERTPQTMLAARFSVPHVAAVAAIHGRIDTATLSFESLSDATVAALRLRVVVGPYEPALPPPNDRPARVRFKFADGREYHTECLCARGSPSTPLAADQIRRKIDEICRDAYPRMPEIMNRLIDLDGSILDTPWRQVVTQMTQQTV